MVCAILDPQWIFSTCAAEPCHANRHQNKPGPSYQPSQDLVAWRRRRARLLSAYLSLSTTRIARVAIPAATVHTIYIADQGKPREQHLSIRNQHRVDSERHRGIPDAKGTGSAAATSRRHVRITTKPAGPSRVDHFYSICDGSWQRSVTATACAGADVARGLPNTGPG